MKRKLVICPICGKINKIKTDNIYNCSFCGHEHYINECSIIGVNESNREIEYIENCFEMSILASNSKNIEKYKQILLKKDNNNFYANYYNFCEIEKSIDYIEKIQVNDSKLYFVLKEDILKNSKISYEVKENLINKLEKNEFKENLLKYINKQEEDDLEIKEDLMKQEVEIIEYKGMSKERFVGLTFLGASLILAILITLFSTFVISEKCSYGAIVVLSLIPSVLLNIALIKIINIKNIILKVLMFVAVFYILSYLMTLHYHQTGFINSFEEHINGIINAIPDILDAINDGFKDGLKGEGK